jgi:hypothetical protein
MTTTNLSRRDTGTRVHADEPTEKKPTEPAPAARLSDLIREEDEKLSATDSGQVLRRRACPSGE